MAESAVFKLAAVDEEQRLVMGYASVSIDAEGQTVVDLENDVIDPDEIQKAFHQLVADGGGDGDVNHNKKHASTLVGCVVLTPQKLDLMLKGLGYEGPLPDFKGVAAWVEYHVDDDATWQRVKSGELKGFSIEAQAARVAA